MDLNLLVERLLNSTINPSPVLDNITKMTGNKYTYLKEELTNQQYRPLTPDQGINLLAKEIAPILTAESIVDVASYGDELSKHASVINDALLELVFNDSLEHSVEDINQLCDKVSKKSKKKVEKKKNLLINQ